MSAVFQRGASFVPAVAIVAAMLTTAVAQSRTTLTADQIKAGFVYNFTKYVNWPATEDSDTDHFHICTAGRDGVVDQLESAVYGKSTAGRSISVRRIDGDWNVVGCEILYVAELPSHYEERLVAAVNGRSILTVGSAPRFLRGTGIITFLVEEGRVRFDINLRVSGKANIHIESRILALARRTEEVSP